ncbi:MAG: CPBP family intramembrane metalloprotease [Halieaceae bacterium]|nr:CPBP family intramembrane metalloprotease [Halieaceae bacterium]
MPKLSRSSLALVAMAIVSTAVMDAVGLSMFSAFTLMVLIPLYWLLTRHTWKAWGLCFGRPIDYGLAVLYPTFVMGSLVLALIAGGADLSATDWSAAARGFAIMAAATVIGSLITEEGFFRGSLFIAAQGDGYSVRQSVVFSSLVFSAWHISWATLSEEGRVALSILPVYLINAALLGAAWGLIRALSGSVLVPSVSHGIWNGAAYTLFGFGSEGGLLAVDNALWLDPERGLLAVVLSGLYVAWLWRRLNQTAA